MQHLTIQQLYELIAAAQGGEHPGKMPAHLRICPQCRALYEALTKEEPPEDGERPAPCDWQGPLYRLAYGQLNLFRVRAALAHLDACPQCGRFVRFLQDRDPAVAEQLARQRQRVSFGKYRRLLEQGAEWVSLEYGEPALATLRGKEDRIIPVEGVLRNGKRFRMEYGREQGTLTVEYFTDPETGLPPPVRLIVHDHSDRLSWSEIVPVGNPQSLVLHFNANEVNIIHIGVVNQMIETFPYISLLGRGEG